MKIREKIKTYNFWVSLGSAVFLILQIAGQKFGFYVDEGLFHDFFTSLCSILVILGIITAPAGKDAQKKQDLKLTLFEPEKDTITRDQENQLSEKNNEIQGEQIMNKATENNELIEQPICENEGQTENQTIAEQTEQENIKVQKNYLTAENPNFESNQTVQESSTEEFSGQTAEQFSQTDSNQEQSIEQQNIDAELYSTVGFDGFDDDPDEIVANVQNQNANIESKEIQERRDLAYKKFAEMLGDDSLTVNLTKDEFYKMMEDHYNAMHSND